MAKKIKFKALVLNLDGEPDSSGDKFYPSSITYKNPVTLFNNWKSEVPLGKAKLYRRGTRLFAEFSLTADQVARIEGMGRSAIYPAIGGCVLGRAPKDHGRIDECKIYSISVQTSFNQDIRIPPIKRVKK